MEITQKIRMRYSKWKGLNGHTYLEELIIRFPEKDWNWYHLSRNASISMQFISKHERYPWEWNAVSSNPNLKIGYVIANLNKKWDWGSISQNPGIFPEDIDRHPNLPWEWRYISSNPNVRPDFYELHKEKDWDIIWGLSRNPHFAGKLQLNFSEMSETDLMICSKVEHVNLEYVIAHPEIRWDWHSYTSSYARTYGIEKILENPHLPWVTSRIFSSAPINEKLLSLPDVHWQSLSFNENLTDDLVERYIDKPWDWYKVVIGKNISFEFAMRHVEDTRLQKYAIFGTKKIPKSMLKNTKNNPIFEYMSAISMNRHLTPGVICDLSSRVDWCMLSYNSFLCSEDMDSEIRRDIKDRQSVVSRCVTDMGICSDVANVIDSYVSWA